MRINRSKLVDFLTRQQSQKYVGMMTEEFVNHLTDFVNSELNRTESLEDILNYNGKDVLI